MRTTDRAHKGQGRVGAINGSSGSQGTPQNTRLEKQGYQRGGDPEDEAGHGHEPNNGEISPRIWTTKM